jgi:hypothetical protein
LKNFQGRDIQSFGNSTRGGSHEGRALRFDPNNFDARLAHVAAAEPELVELGKSDTISDFLVQHPETVENVLRALLDAIAFIQEPENKTTLMKSLAQWLRLPKPDDALEGYNFMWRMYRGGFIPT